MNEATDYVLAQVNIGRLVAPLDSEQLAGFVASLDRVNAVADTAPGFIWRLQTEEGNATSVRVFEDDAEGADGGILVNMSVWESVEALGTYVYGDAHLGVLRRRREWFEKMADAYAALWWIERHHIPTTAEAEDRLRHLRKHGPTPYAFTLRAHFPPPGSGAIIPPVPAQDHMTLASASPGAAPADPSPLQSPEDWACPV
jgi:hypothetical protein